MVVTGASSGLGEQLAHALAGPGAMPVLAARRADRLAALSEAIPGADAVTCDVTDEADRRRLVETVLERHGRLDGLVNNAGAGATAPALRTSTDAFAQVIDLNLTAPFGLSCLAAAALMRNGGRTLDRQHRVGHGPSLDRRDPRRGVRRVEGRLIGLTRELASQWGRYGIRVNAVAPGFFASEMNAELGDDPEAFPDFLLDRTPLGRGGRPGSSTAPCSTSSAAAPAS